MNLQICINKNLIIIINIDDRYVCGITIFRIIMLVLGLKLLIAKHELNYDVSVTIHADPFRTSNFFLITNMHNI